MADIVSEDEARIHLKLDPDVPRDQFNIPLKAGILAAEEFMNRRVYADPASLAAAKATLTGKSVEYAEALDTAFEVADAITNDRARTDARDAAWTEYGERMSELKMIQNGIVVNEMIKAGILLAATDIYELRSDNEGTTPKDYHVRANACLQPYRVGVGV